MNNPRSSNTNKRKTKNAAMALIALSGWIVALLLFIGVWQPTQSPTAPLPANGTASLPDNEHEPGEDSAPTTVPGRQIVQLVNDQYPKALAGDEGWDYHRTLVTDLNGDGNDETVHVIARVARYNEGQGADAFAWDDGQQWQVYVENQAGDITYVFSDWVQLGNLRVVSLDHFAEPESRGVGIIREQGAGITLYEARYRAPGDTDVVQVGHVSILNEATPALTTWPYPF